MSCASCHSALLDGQIGLGSLIGKMAELANHDLFHSSSRSEIYMVIYESESECFSVVSDSLQPHELYSPWNSPGQNTGVGSLSLLRGIFPTQGSNLGLPHCRRILYQLSHGENPRILEWVAYPFSRRSSQHRDPTRSSCISGRLFTS